MTTVTEHASEFPTLHFAKKNELCKEEQTSLRGKTLLSRAHFAKNSTLRKEKQASLNRAHFIHFAHNHSHETTVMDPNDTKN